MARVALLSNPQSTGNKLMLPQLRSYCAEHADIFHFEVDEITQIPEALIMISRVGPKVLVINGGDGTVHATLTELHNGQYFDGTPPPVAALPNGRTNLIAFNLGAHGDALATLERIVELAKGDLDDHVIARELIELSDGEENKRPVLGMFLGGAGLAETILYCREKIYPLGLPNRLSHAIAALATLFSTLFRTPGGLLPRRAKPVRVSLLKNGTVQGAFSLLMVTTLEKLLFGGRALPAGKSGRMQFMAVDQGPLALLKMAALSLVSKLGQHKIGGTYVEQGDIIRIDSEQCNVILDGEVFEANAEHPIFLRSTKPVSFLKLAA